jgi:Skp family chaperone for outer membrane proteins
MASRSSFAMGVVAIAGVALVLAWSQGRAQGPSPDSKYAVVDAEQVLDTCQQTVDTKRLISERSERLQKQLESRRQAIHTKQADFTALHPDSPEAYKLQEELDRLQIEFETVQKIEQGEMLRERNLWVAEVYRQLMATIKQIAEAKGLDMVLFQDSFDPKNPTKTIIERMGPRRVLYARQYLDLTDEVLRVLNEAYAQRGGAVNIKIGL